MDIPLHYWCHSTNPEDIREHSQPSRKRIQITDLYDYDVYFSLQFNFSKFEELYIKSEKLNWKTKSRRRKKKPELHVLELVQQWRTTGKEDITSILENKNKVK
jgi:hypothetical protein